MESPPYPGRRSNSLGRSKRQSPPPLRAWIHSRGMLDGREFFLSDKELFRSNSDGLQGKSTRNGGKKAVQTAFSGCEYRFLKWAKASPIPARALDTIFRLR